METKIEPFAFADDRLWVGKIPIRDVYCVFNNPKKWVCDNVDPKCVLKEPYVISVLPLGEEHGYGLKDNRMVLVEGIDGTNLITMRAGHRAPEHFVSQIRETMINPGVSQLGVLPERFPNTHQSLLDSSIKAYNFKEYWRTFSDRTLDITICEGDNRAYIHFEIWKKPTTAFHVSDEQIISHKNYNVALFHLHAASDPDFLLQILTSAHRSNRTNLNYLDAQDAEEIARPLSRPITFARRAGTVPILASGESGSSETVCEMLLAMYKQGIVTYDQAYSKNYTKPVESTISTKFLAPRKKRP